MNPFYTAIAARALHRCEYCHAPELVFNFPFEVEHIIPTFLDGQDEESNFALACRSCNLYKWTYRDGIDPTTKTTVRLFNPRTDSWNAHFRFNRNSGLLVGITQIGRATIDRLHINSIAQIAARKQWGSIGIFP
jgi:hypothetical protein